MAKRPINLGESIPLRVLVVDHVDHLCVYESPDGSERQTVAISEAVYTGMRVSGSPAPESVGVPADWKFVSAHSVDVYTHGDSETGPGDMTVKNGTVIGIALQEEGINLEGLTIVGTPPNITILDGGATAKFIENVNPLEREYEIENGQLKWTFERARQS